MKKLLSVLILVVAIQVLSYAQCDTIIVDAGNDTTVCGKEIDLNVTGSLGTGQWIPVAGISFDNFTSPTAHATYITYGTVELAWVEYVDTCVLSDTIVITFAEQPDANDPMWMDTINTYSVCGTDFITLQAPDPLIPGADSYWWDEIAGTTFHPVNPSDHLNDTARIDPGQYGLHTFHWIINNSGCIDTSAGINIYFIEQPYPDAGPRYDTACGDIYILDGFQSIDTSDVTWISLDPMYILFASTNWDTYGDTIHDTVKCNLPLPQIKEIYLTESNGMCVTRDTITITFLDVIGMENLQYASYKLQIYPNPNKDILNIIIYTKEKQDLIIELVDVMGRVVYNNEVKKVSHFKDEIDVSEFAKGVYYLRLIAGSRVKVEKLIIQ